MTALGLSCSMWHLVPWSGIETRSLHQEQGVLATGPPGKSLDVVWKMGPSLTPKLSKRVANLLWRYCLAPASIVGSGDLSPQWVPKSWHHPTALDSSVINLQRAVRCITFKPSRPQTPDCNRLVTHAPPDFSDLTLMSPTTSPSASPMLPFNPPPFLSLLLCTPRPPGLPAPVQWPHIMNTLNPRKPFTSLWGGQRGNAFCLSSHPLSYVWLVTNQRNEMQ